MGIGDYRIETLSYYEFAIGFLTCLIGTAFGAGMIEVWHLPRHSKRRLIYLSIFTLLIGIALGVFDFNYRLLLISSRIPYCIISIATLIISNILAGIISALFNLDTEKVSGLIVFLFAFLGVTSFTNWLFLARRYSTTFFPAVTALVGLLLGYSLTALLLFYPTITYDSLVDVRSLVSTLFTTGLFISSLVAAILSIIIPSTKTVEP
jgi:MFS family permease